MPLEQTRSNSQGEETEPKENNFAAQYIESTGQTIVVIKAAIMQDDWDVLTALVRTRMDAGAIAWDMDLRQVPLLTSLMLGSIVGINMLLQTRKGNLRLLVEKESRVAKLLYMSKLNRIIMVREV